MKSPHNFLYVVAALAAMTCCPRIANAQKLTIRLVNARSGKPLHSQNVTVKWDNQPSVEEPVDQAGVAPFAIPPSAVSFVVIPGPRNGKEPYRIAYRNCNKQVAKPFLIEEVLKNGLLQENICGKAKRIAQPAEIIFWALPRPLVDWQ